MRVLPRDPRLVRLPTRPDDSVTLMPHYDFRGIALAPIPVSDVEMKIVDMEIPPIRNERLADSK